MRVRDVGERKNVEDKWALVGMADGCIGGVVRVLRGMWVLIAPTQDGVCLGEWRDTEKRTSSDA